MRRTVVLVGVWLLVAAAAVAVAWHGVSVVGDQVTDERPASLAAADIEQQLAETATSAVPGGTSSLPAGGTTPSSEGPAPSSSPTSGPSAPTTAPTAAPAGETRSYNLTGGTAALRFAPTGVTVLFANPAPGFAVQVEPEHGNGVKVEFESEGHESRVDGWWDGGPVDRVREEAED